MGDIEIQARTYADAACLVRELASFSPTQERRVIKVGLDAAAPTSDLFAVLGAVDECLRTNGIPSVRISLDGRSYLLAPRRVP
jgi:hypothetical protein